MNSSGGTRKSTPEILRSPHLLLFLSYCFLAANFVVVRGIHEQYPPIVLSLWRWGGAALILLPFTWAGIRDEWRTIRDNWVVLAVCALLLPILGSLTGYLAMTMTVAVNGGIIRTVMPVAVVVLSWMLGIERITTRQAIGFAVAMGGVLGILTRGDPEILLGLRFNAGDLLLLLSSFGIAGYTVLVKRLSAKPTALVFLTVICGIGGLFHIPLVAFEMAQGSVMRFNTATSLAILYVAIFPSLLAVMFYNYGIEKLGPNRTAAYNYILPVITAALAYLFLDEAIAGFHVVGTMLIIFGVYMTARHGPARQVLN